MSDDSRSRTKRRKLSTDKPHEDYTPIRSADDLKILLAFEQNLATVESRLQRFKSFLNDLRRERDADNAAIKRAVLLQFLQRGQPASSKGDESSLSGLILSWQLAVKLENDTLCSLIPTVASLMFKCIASFVEFREPGRLLCRLFLRPEQMHLLERSLKAHLSKGHLIDPCLRFLTEMVHFDGGSAAGTVSRLRNVTFFRLDEFMGARRRSKGTPPSERKHASTRETAVKYFLLNLSLQDSDTKGYLLDRSRKLFHALLDDPPYMIDRLLNTLKEHVLNDVAIDSAVKNRFFNATNLMNLSALYSYNEGPDVAPNATIRYRVHRFLASICLSSKHGFLQDATAAASRTGDSFHEKVVNSSGAHQEDRRANTFDKETDLVKFLQTLRPSSDNLQADLIVDAFRQKPEIAHPYFLGTGIFPFEPKLTVTWIGYARFLMAVAQVEVDEKAILRLAQQTDAADALLDMILPRPCTQVVMSKCLNQASSLVTFLSLNILNAGFNKFHRILDILQCDNEAISGAKTVISKLRAGFGARCPPMRHLVFQFQSSTEENDVLRESILRLMLHYYRLTPDVALGAKVDVSGALASALTRRAEYSEPDPTNRLLGLQVDSLVEIALLSPGIRWFSQPAGLASTPFGLLFRTCVFPGMESPRIRMRACRAIACEHYILQPATAIHNFATLLAGVEQSQISQADTICNFIDQCASKVARAQMYYHNKLQASSEGHIPSHDSSAIDLLLFSMFEQWERMLSKESEDARALGPWLKIYLQTLTASSADNKVLTAIVRQFQDTTGQKDLALSFDGLFESSTESDLRDRIDACERILESEHKHTDRQINEPEEVKMSDNSPALPPQESENHPELSRWMREDIEDCFVDGIVGELVLCLCSMHEEIRNQAVIALTRIMSQIEAVQSTFRQWRQEKLVLLEVLETYANNENQPLPYVIGQIAASFVKIQGDPLDCMYPKVNQFLLQAPQWRSSKLVGYWMRAIILSAPVEDKTYYEEVCWLLGLLQAGLRTPKDMDFYRKCNVFEPLLSTCLTMPDAQIDQILGILKRCTALEGGTTLITRYGLLSWIEGVKACKPQLEQKLTDIAERLWASRDESYITAWQQGQNTKMGVEEVEEKRMDTSIS